VLLECIVISFDISSKNLDDNEATYLRRDISYKIGTALRDAGIGKSSGGNCNRLNTIEIFILTDNPDEAIPIIESTLNDHWLQPYMQIRRQAPSSKEMGNEKPLNEKLRKIRMFR